MRYDANDRPHSATWLKLDETERVDAVMAYHRRIGVKLENPELHAITHVVVENQIALGEPTPVPDTLNRLVDEGLDGPKRHLSIAARATCVPCSCFWVTRRSRARCATSGSRSMTLSR